MNETPQQYTQRILGYLEGKVPLEVLAATPRQIARLVKGVPRKKQSQRKRGKETVTRVVEMLAGHDINHMMQIKERLPKE